MTTMSITEALAEVRLVEKKMNQRVGLLTERSAGWSTDPELKVEDQPRALLQSVTDLSRRASAIRKAIASKNAETKLTVEGLEMSVMEWLVWKRDLASIERNALSAALTKVKRVRNESRQPKVSGDKENPLQFELVTPRYYIEEPELEESLLKLDTALERLDGKLSLNNATVTVEIPD